MQYWIELSMGLVAAAAVIVAAVEGLRIYAAWRRTHSGTANT